MNEQPPELVHFLNAVLGTNRRYDTEFDVDELRRVWLLMNIQEKLDEDNMYWWLALGGADEAELPAGLGPYPDELDPDEYADDPVHCDECGAEVPKGSRLVCPECGNDVIPF